MRVIELKAENFKKLKAVTIRPDGSLVQVTGSNSSGKTSTLDAIWAALKGAGAKIAEPIRKGQEQARIKLDVGEYVITRTFRRDKHGDVTVDLKVVAADGSEVRRTPQTVIDSLLGALSLDPLAFARATAKEQFDVLKRFVPGFDFEANAAARQKAFDERTDVNRLAKRDRGSAQNIQLPAGPKPSAVDVSGLLDELTRISDHNADAERIDIRRRAMAEEMNHKCEEAERLRAHAVTLEKQADAIAAKLTDSLDPSLTPKHKEDASPVRAKLGQAEATKGIIALFDQREAFERSAAAKETESASLTERIEELDRLKAAAIELAKMPVEGLTLGDGEVLYKGVPFSQASHAEKLIVSASVAMAENPELRIIRCYEGSNLDSKSLGALAAMASSKDWQVWLERVDESGEVGFVIADGEIAS